MKTCKGCAYMLNDNPDKEDKRAMCHHKKSPWVFAMEKWEACRLYAEEVNKDNWLDYKEEDEV